MTQKCVSATLDWFVVIDDRFLHKNRLLPVIPTKCRYIGLQVESRCEEYLNIAKVIDSFDFILSLIKTRNSRLIRREFLVWFNEAPRE